MSRYIQLVNRIKQGLDQLNLTKNQDRGRVVILSRLEYPGVINLFGRHGTGKTSLGWWLAKNARAAYLVEPKQMTMLQPSAKFLFVDNADYRRDDFRRVLGDLERCRINRAVLVTHQRIEDSVQSFELDFDSEDLQVARANFEKLGYPVTSSILSCLWDILRDASLM